MPREGFSQGAEWGQDTAELTVLLRPFYAPQIPCLTQGTDKMFGIKKFPSRNFFR